MHDKFEIQIEQSKQKIAELEKKLPSGLLQVFSQTSARNINKIQEKIAKERLTLAKLYKSCNQPQESLPQLQKAYDYFNNPSEKNYTSAESLAKQCIDILTLQLECSKTNKERMQLIDEILSKIPLTKNGDYYKDAPKYLDEYARLSPNWDGLNRISYFIETIDRKLHSGSKTYSYALNVQADLYCELNEYKLGYETLNRLIHFYQDLPELRAYTFSKEEQIQVYLKAYSIECIKSFPVQEKISSMVVDYYQQNIKSEQAFYEVQFEDTFKPEAETALKKLAEIYYFKKFPLPDWFPKHQIKQLEALSFFPTNKQLEKEPTFSQKSVKKQDNVLEEIDLTPTYQKIRDKITLDWESFGVAGYKTEIKMLVDQLFVPRTLSPEQLAEWEIKLPRGGIIFGPPGTGKTLMARTVAQRFVDKDNVIIINGPELISKFIGQSAQNLRDILDAAKINPNETYVVIIDEIDALISSRDKADDNQTNQLKADLTTTLLTYLDGINVIDNLMIIGLTNYFERLDDALIRSGRLDTHINIELPNHEYRLEIIKYYLSGLQKKGKLSPNIDIELLTQKSEGLSGADIKCFIDKTKKKFGVSQHISYETKKFKISDTTKITPLTTDQFLICLNEVQLANKHKQSEMDRLLARPHCEYRQSLDATRLTIRNQAKTFAYLNPMLIHVTGESGSGTSSFALNLFNKSEEDLVYLHAGDLVNLNAEKQQARIDSCFTKALLKGQGTLIIDNLEDIHSCTYNPLIYLKTKMKRSLADGEKLKVILISKDENTVDDLFKGQIECDAKIKIPLISHKEEIIKIINSFNLDINLNSSKQVALKVELSMKKLLNYIYSYCNKTKPELRTIDEIIENLNSLYPDYNANRLFQEKQQANIPSRLGDFHPT